MPDLDPGVAYPHCLDQIARRCSPTDLAAALLDALIGLTGAQILYAEAREGGQILTLLGGLKRNTKSTQNLPVRQAGCWFQRSADGQDFRFYLSDGGTFHLRGQARGAYPSKSAESLLASALRLRAAISRGLENATLSDYDSLRWVEETSLSDRLKLLAGQHRTLPGLRALLVAALDSANDPLAAGRWGDFAIDTTLPTLSLVARLEAALPEGACPPEGWPVDPTVLGGRPGRPLRAWPMQPGRRRRGLLVAALVPGAPELTLRTLRRFARLCDLVVRDAVRGMALARMRRLQDLASHLPDHFDDGASGLPMVVEQVREVFDAAAASLFLLPGPTAQSIRLAATTDEPLQQKSETRRVEYRSGQGLTGTVFALARPVRLVNALDPVEIAAKTPLRDRTGPTHTEAAVDNNPMLQFLAAPVRQGARTLGVLRLTRAAGREHFNAEDEAALQMFSDLLGAYLGNLGLAERFRRLWENPSEALWLVERDPLGDQDGALVEANRFATGLFGRDIEELRTLSLSDLFSPESGEAVGRVGSFPAERPIRVEILHRDGGRTPAEILFHRVVDPRFHPPFELMLAVGRPIADREAMLAEHQHLLELLNDLRLIYFRTDAEGRRVRTSALEAEVTGYSEQELLGKRVEELYAEPGARPRLMAEALKERGAVQGRLLPLVRRVPGGTAQFWAEVDLRVYHSNTDEAQGAAGLYREVSERIELQEFLDATGLNHVASDAELRQLVLQRDRANVDYLTNIGHQLKIPLAGLQNMLLNYKDGILSGELFARRLDYALGQIHVCVALVENLGFMRRILSREPIRVSSQPVSLAQLTVELKLNFMHLLQEKRLYLYIDDPSLERFCQVRGDRDLLRQVLANLVHNAVKYSFEGTEIRVRGVLTAQGPSYQIANVGIPIQAEEREKIFNREYRSALAATLDPGGTGLGLWLCRRILERHHYHIRCDVETRQGVTWNLFTIDFRARPEGGP